jgi:uncharacterized protein YaaR (DUF327 family)
MSEISRVERAGLTRPAAKTEVPGEKLSFTEILAERRGTLNVEKLKKTLKDIEKQGKVLANTCTAEDLMKYKKMIKDFFDEVLKHSLKVEQRTGFRRMKIYKTIEIVDQKLLDLSDAILKQQEKGLNILARIGQIQGLLVDILA